MPADRATAAYSYRRLARRKLQRLNKGRPDSSFASVSPTGVCDWKEAESSTVEEIASKGPRVAAGPQVRIANRRASDLI
jgi:hypothetical protein